MVHLSYTVPEHVKSKTLHKWEHDVRENHESYQEEIDRTTYQLQRAQRGWFLQTFFYPAFQQHHVQNLQVLKLKQSVGKIYQEEVNDYKTINPQISSYLNKQFSSRWYWPSAPNLALMAGLQAYAHTFNFAFSWRLFFVAAPWAVETFVSIGSNYHSVPTVEFLNWVLQVRKSKAQVETAHIDAELVKKYNSVTEGVKKPLLDVYEDFLNLARSAEPNL